MRPRSVLCWSWRVIIVVGVLSFASATHAQRIAIVVPEKSDLSMRVAEDLARLLDEKGSGRIDLDAADSAFRTFPQQDLFNLEISHGKELGSLLGADVNVLIKAGTQRRTSLERAGYFESSAAIYLVSSRSGQLFHWGITTFDGESENAAEKGLLLTLPTLAENTLEKARTIYRSEINQRPAAPRFPALPEPGSPDAKGFRPPVPYRRIKPEYTRQAFLFGVRATVEIEVNIDAEGNIVGTEIVRWAGYGLDESVETAVRAMNWRPAERNGKTLPSRVLLRYNFTKIENDPR